MAASHENRRVYLMQRLARRQITMEEATELFTLMNRDIEALRRSLPPPPPPPGTPGARPSPTSPQFPQGLAGLSTQNLEELLIFGGPLIGMLAAVLKRSMEGPLPAPTSSTENPPLTDAAPPAASESKAPPAKARSSSASTRSAGPTAKSA